MARPILTLELSDDEREVFIYSGGIEIEGGTWQNDRTLLGIVPVGYDDTVGQITEYVERVVQGEVTKE